MGFFDDPQHLFVDAKAGTGKTTSLVGGVNVLRGVRNDFTPSPQQIEIFKSVGLSMNDARTMCAASFGHDITEVLKKRLPPGVFCKTLHGFGNGMLYRAFGKQEPIRGFTKSNIAKILKTTKRELEEKEPVLLSGTAMLASKCKLTLTDWKDEKALDELCNYYEIDCNSKRDDIYGLLPKVMDMALQPKGQIEYDDMIWVPLQLKLPAFRNRVGFFDEVQDFNRAQQELAMLLADRMVLYGDPNQSIFGFAGADCESIPRLQKILGATPRGVQTLPLTVTRRCGRAIVEEAKRIVPEFEAHESNPDGEIREDTYRKYAKSIIDGDFILCRVNAPLISQCLKFIKEGRKANVQGKDVSKGLIWTLERVWTYDCNVYKFLEKLGDWCQNEIAKESAKQFPSEMKIEGFRDRHDCLEAFCSEANNETSRDQVVQRIQSVFTDDKSIEGIRLSSIHKAKGLEANRVVLLQLPGATVPHPSAKTDWQRQQERNLLYVAITRAITTLTYVY
jgi:superfamily I DNA/RNA helicase